MPSGALPTGVSTPVQPAAFAASAAAAGNGFGAAHAGEPGEDADRHRRHHHRQHEPPCGVAPPLSAHRGLARGARLLLALLPVGARPVLLVRAPGRGALAVTARGSARTLARCAARAVRTTAPLLVRHQSTDPASGASPA